MIIVKEHVETNKLWIPVFWATQEEVKLKLKIKREEQEMKVIEYLVKRKKNPSISGKILKIWDLDRDKIKKVLNYVARFRHLQVEFLVKLISLLNKAQYCNF